MTQPMDCGMVFQKTISLQPRFGFRLLWGVPVHQKGYFEAAFIFVKTVLFFN